MAAKPLSQVAWDTGGHGSSVSLQAAVEADQTPPPLRAGETPGLSALPVQFHTFISSMLQPVSHQQVELHEYKGLEGQDTQFTEGMQRQ